jgi:5-methylcytosine-specific restriction endonuclease McrA
MLLQGKAETIEESGKVIRSPSLLLPLPTVIRLMNYIKRSYGKGVAFSKKNVFLRDNFTCQYCGSHGVDLTIDHIIPRSKGGMTCWENVVVACKHCNLRKGNRSLDETDLHLLRRPKRPHFLFLQPAPLSLQFLFHDREKYLLGE